MITNARVKQAATPQYFGLLLAPLRLLVDRLRGPWIRLAWRARLSAADRWLDRSPVSQSWCDRMTARPWLDGRQSAPQLTPLSAAIAWAAAVCRAVPPTRRGTDDSAARGTRSRPPLQRARTWLRFEALAWDCVSSRSSAASIAARFRPSCAGHGDGSRHTRRPRCWHWSSAPLTWLQVRW